MRRGPYSQLSRSGRREADPVPESVAAGRPEPEYHEKGIGDGAAGDLTIVRPTAAAALKAARAGQALNSPRRIRRHPRAKG
jgi:hypothetical protein